MSFKFQMASVWHPQKTLSWGQAPFSKILVERLVQKKQEKLTCQKYFSRKQ